MPQPSGRGDPHARGVDGVTGLLACVRGILGRGGGRRGDVGSEPIGYREPLSVDVIEHQLNLVAVIPDKAGRLRLPRQRLDGILFGVGDDP